MVPLYFIMSVIEYWACCIVCTVLMVICKGLHYYCCPVIIIKEIANIPFLSVCLSFCILLYCFKFFLLSISVLW